MILRAFLPREKKRKSLKLNFIQYRLNWQRKFNHSMVQLQLHDISSKTISKCSLMIDKHVLTFFSYKYSGISLLTCYYPFNVIIHALLHQGCRSIDLRAITYALTFVTGTDFCERHITEEGAV